MVLETFLTRILAARPRGGLEALEHLLRWLIVAWLVAFVVSVSQQAMPVDVSTLADQTSSPPATCSSDWCSSALGQLRCHWAEGPLQRRVRGRLGGTLSTTMRSSMPWRRATPAC